MFGQSPSSTLVPAWPIAKEAQASAPAATMSVDTILRAVFIYCAPDAFQTNS
tara:strand:- start:999 stop:1154 length:156 start_codon:yes stop_codon:yes gene_type:complete